MEGGNKTQSSKPNEKEEEEDMEVEKSPEQSTTVPPSNWKNTPVTTWTKDNVFEWVKETLNLYEDYAKTAAKALKDELVIGSSLLRLTKEELVKEYGFLKGPASDLAGAIAKLQAQTEATLKPAVPYQRPKFRVEDYLGYVGPEDELRLGFSGKIPYFADIQPEKTKQVATILAQPEVLPNKYVLANFDFSGIGKSTLFHQLAKLMGGHYVRFDCSLGSPLALVYEKAKDIISKKYDPKDFPIESHTVISELTPIFKLAFLECLKLITKALTSRQSSVLEEIDMKNGPSLAEELLNSKDFDKKWKTAVSEIVPLLDSRPIIILFDELQRYGTTLKTVKRADIPEKVFFKRSKPGEFDISDLYLPVIYECLGELVQEGTGHCIRFALAGTYGSLKTLLVHSPCTVFPAFRSLLPLQQFNNTHIAMVWDHYWKFPSLSAASREKIFSQINGPPRVTEYFMAALLEISLRWKRENKKVEDVSEGDLQEAVDLAYNSFCQSMDIRLVGLSDQFFSYKLLTIFPLLYGGEFSGEEIIFKDKDNYGFKFLQENSDKLMETGLVRISFSAIQDSYSLCRPYPFIERHIAEKYFASRRRILNVIMLTLSNKPKCFEHLLAREFCISACNLMKTIADADDKKMLINFDPQPREKDPNDIEFAKLCDFPDLKKAYDHIMTVDDTNTQLVGDHKIDIFVPVKNGRIYIQATTMNQSGDNHNKQPNLKARKFFEAACQQLPENVEEPNIFVFASLHDFEISQMTKTECEKHGRKNVICMILKGKDFDNCYYPFYLLRKEDTFTNPESVEIIARAIEKMAPNTWSKDLVSPALKRRKLNDEK